MEIPNEITSSLKWKEFPKQRNSLRISEKKIKCVLRYKTLDGLMLYFNPNAELGEPKELITGDYPTLLDINAVFGDTASQQCVIPQLDSLEDFCGCKDKFSMAQLDWLSDIISKNYQTLKISELWVFFTMFKAGKYGHFYGSLDAITVTTALNEFMHYRNQVYEDYERKKEEERVHRCAHNPKAITYEEYLRRKKHGEKEKCTKGIGK